MSNGAKDRNMPKFPKRNVPYYGQAVGILIFDVEASSPNVPDKFPLVRIPGDVGNATTFDFPVQYKVMKNGISISDVVNEAPTKETERKIVEVTRELAKEGVRAIGTSCGFMSYFQPAMADAVEIPVFSSSLLQVPIVTRLIGKGRKVGILTNDSRKLSNEHLARAGINKSLPISVFDLERLPVGKSMSIQETDPEKRLQLLEEQLICAATQFLSEDPKIGAIVFECTNHTPASAAVQKATGLPVFDVVTLLNWAYNAVVRKRYSGFL